RCAGVKGWLRQRDLDRELDDEIQCHLSLEAEANQRRGMSRADAERKARLDFGSIESVREEMRAQARTYWVRERLKDLRYGWRQLIKTPSYGLTMVGVLTAGIGLAVAVLTVAHQVLIAPLSYADAAQVVVLHEVNSDQSLEPEDASPGNFFDWVEMQSGFSKLGAAAPYGLDLRSGDRLVSLDTSRVSLDYLPALGARMAAGRAFDKAHFEPGAEPSVILSWESWQQRFEASADLVGATIELDGRPTRVVGILDQRTPDLRGAELLTPLSMGPGEAAGRSGNYLTVVGRLQLGVDVEQASEEMRAIAATIAAAHPTTNSGWTVQLVSLREHLFGRETGIVIALLVSCVLLLGIVFANLSALAMARGLARAPELAIRHSLGATRRVLIRQLAIESLIPVAISLILGAGLSFSILNVLARHAPPSLSDLSAYDFGPTLAAGLLILALATTVVAVVLPAARLTGRDLGNAMRISGGRSTRTRQNIRAQQALIALQVCLTMVLIAGSGLLYQSLLKLLATDLGFADNGRVVVELFTYSLHPEPGARVAFEQSLLNQLENRPELEDVATGSSLPLVPALYSREGIEVIGGASGDEGLRASANSISERYFDVLEIPLLAGRSFDAADTYEARRVTVVSQQFANRHFGNASPLGERLKFGVLGAPQEWTIVGVVGDVLDAGPATPPQPTVYVPNAQARIGGMSIVARSRVAPAQALDVLQNEIWRISPGQSLSASRTLSAAVDEALQAARFVLTLLSIFAAAAVGIAMIGLYGTTSYFVRRRKRETTIRVALGLTPLRALMWVQSQTLVACLVGIAVGAVVLIMGMVWLQALIYTTSVRDPLVILGSATIIFVLAILAATPSSIRSANTDPSLALRQD
ncbi:MAG: ABC transporter permease, partial [Pseudomonadota bacterium]